MSSSKRQPTFVIPQNSGYANPMYVNGFKTRCPKCGRWKEWGRYQRAAYKGFGKKNHHKFWLLHLQKEKD